MDENRRAFYEYHAAMMEPWDGPAAIAFTDGRQIGATLDRNGLRPARYLITDDDLVVLASEAGVLPIPESRIVKKWRLQPGRMFLIDTEAGRIIEDAELKNALANAKPYREWISRIRIKLDALEAAVDLPTAAASAAVESSAASLLDRQQAFGYTQEDLRMLMAPMATAGEEATGSMGNDSPLAVTSDRDKPLYNYFRQLFAQVTNPPIDPIREQLVMSLVSFVGPKPNLLDVNNINPPMRLEVSQPVLDVVDMAVVRNIDRHTSNKFKSHELDICYPVAWGAEGIEARLASLCAEAVDAVKSGFNILIVSDRKIDRERVAIPALLATSAIHGHLVARGLRTSTGLVVETGSAREVHHIAVLAAYGAEAIHPYLAMETLGAMHADLSGDLSAEKAIANYTKAIGKGLMKVMSKMGISTYMSYCGAQIFEAVGLSQSLVDQYFTRHGVEDRRHRRCSTSRRRRSGCIGARSATTRRSTACSTRAASTRIATRGEAHMWTPDTIAKLQHATRGDSFSTYKEYATLVNDQSRRLMTLRGLFEFKVDPAKAIPLSEVEPAVEIVKRFATGAMSLGSISTEAHTTLAVAMNRIGGKSNTGEGGEDPARYENELKGIPIAAGETLASVLGPNRIVADVPLREGDSLRSRIKQVASGRFGVTAEYLPVGRPDPDQDGAGREARRRRPAAGPQGVRVHRQAALLGAGRRADLAAAASRHLLDRGPRAADPRPEEREPTRVDLGQARVRGRRRHDRGRRREGEGRPRDDRRPRRRHRRVAGLVDQARRHAVGARPRRDAADARAQPAARPHRGAGRRPDEDRPRRRHRRDARRRRVRLRDGAAGRRPAAS